MLKYLGETIKVLVSVNKDIKERANCIVSIEEKMCQKRLKIKKI